MPSVSGALDTRMNARSATAPALSSTVQAGRRCGFGAVAQQRVGAGGERQLLHLAAHVTDQGCIECDGWIGWASRAAKWLVEIGAQSVALASPG